MSRAPLVTLKPERGFARGNLELIDTTIGWRFVLGCSGARLLCTLAWELHRRGGRYGVATMCIGVGQGVAAVIENPAA